MSAGIHYPVLIAVFGIAVTVTWASMQYARYKSLIDFPGERSSHSAPTPTGGGIGIILPVLGLAIWLGTEDLLARGIVVALVGGGALIALVGWIDDHINAPVIWRLLVHSIAAIWALYWLGGLSSVDIGALQISLGWVGSVVAVIGIVWMTNLYNFMDGIDGIAAVESISTAVLVGIALAFTGAHGLSVFAFGIAAASAGFLVWNWPPSRIFMGDVGSGFLGFIFSIFAIATEKSADVPLLIWVILLLVFIGDATSTLIRRILAGEKWYTAHCSHAYQSLVRAGRSHKWVTVAVLCLNVTVLWPIAVLCWNKPELSPWLLVMACMGMFLLWWMIQRLPIETHQKKAVE